jgi:hypothetical protein
MQKESFSESDSSASMMKTTIVSFICIMYHENSLQRLHYCKKNCLTVGYVIFLIREWLALKQLLSFLVRVKIFIQTTK